MKTIEGDLKLSDEMKYDGDLLVTGNLFLQWWDDEAEDFRSGCLEVTGNLEVKGTITSPGEGGVLVVGGSLKTEHVCLESCSELSAGDSIEVTGFAFLGTETELTAQKLEAKAVFFSDEVYLHIEEDNQNIEHAIQFWHDDEEDAMEMLNDAVLPEFAAIVVDEDIDPLRISDYLTDGGSVFPKSS